MFSKRTRWGSLLTLVAVFAALGVFFYRPEAVQVWFADIRDSDGKLLTSINLPDGRFDHVFTHSIHLTPVVERFMLEKTADNGVALRLFELRYQSSGVGMPSDAEGGYRLENGVFILTMDREFMAIPLMVSTVEGHGIMAGDKFYPFRAWAESEERLTISGRVTWKIQCKGYADARQDN